MAVAEGVYADTADNIYKGIAVDIGNRAAARLFHCDAGEQRKILQSGSQMLIFTLAQRVTKGPGMAVLIVAFCCRGCRIGFFIERKCAAERRIGDAVEN